MLRRFGKADVVDLILQHYYGACGWGTARFDAGIHCVQHGPAGDVVAASDSDGRIHFICAQTGEALVCPLRGHESKVRSVSWSPDGTKVASGSDDETVRIWEVATGKQLSQLTGHSNWVTSVSWSPDGKRLASGSYDNTVRIWEVATGKELSQLTVHLNGVTSVSWSPDGKRLASGSWDKTVRIWEVATGKELWQLRCDSGVCSVSWSPDGARIAAGGGEVWIFDTASGAPVGSSLKAHSDWVRAVAWSPCGQWLASGGDDKMVYAYDAKTFEVKWPLTGHQYLVNSVNFSPDGKRLVRGHTRQFS